ncbi:uncharacterized protein LOC107459173 [Arachis duranensis]|uniref:Uncharacterized protein LOC107459173 n=1 Tax=Arachis duranensis TaxID=130453 RepID=A0A6P4AXX4_ARADU|nr:uncharacterized protein LOC107459173 [Arachis duranensis]
MHVPEFPKYVNMGEGNVAVEDGEFSVGIKLGSRELVVSVIKGYTISRGVDYTVYESKPQTFYVKCKGYGVGCDWLILASLIQKKEVQSRFNYTVSYHKAWLAKQKSATKVFGDWKVSYQTLPVWLKAMTAKMPMSRVQIKTLPVYRENEEIHGVRVLYRIFWSYYPCIIAFRHCKPLVQIDGTHLYRNYKGALLVTVAQDRNQNIVPIAFAIIESETADAWEVFLTNLWGYVITIDGVSIISDRHNCIDAVIGHNNGA